MKLNKILQILTEEEYKTIYRALINLKINNDTMIKIHEEIYKQSGNKDALENKKNNEEQNKIINQLIKI